MTTEGTVTAEHARLRVNDGGPSWYDPLYPQDIRTFEGYSFEMLGIRLADEAAPYYGLRQLWSGPPTDVRYVQVCWKRSVLYAEFTATKRKKDAAIHGAHLEHSAEDRERAWAAMGLIFKGLKRGLRRGREGTADPERREWWLLAQTVGWDAARAEHKKAGGKYLEWKRIQRHK